MEQAGIYHFQQIEILLLILVKVCLEDGHSVIMQLPAREPIAPPGRFVVDVIKIVPLNKLGARWNRIFHQQVFPGGSRDGKAHSDGVALRNRSLQRRKIVNDVVSLVDGR